MLLLFLGSILDVLGSLRRLARGDDRHDGKLAGACLLIVYVVEPVALRLDPLGIICVLGSRPVSRIELFGAEHGRCVGARIILDARPVRMALVLRRIDIALGAFVVCPRHGHVRRIGAHLAPRRRVYTFVVGAMRIAF